MRVWCVKDAFSHSGIESKLFVLVIYLFVCLIVVALSMHVYAHRNSISIRFEVKKNWVKSDERAPVHVHGTLTFLWLVLWKSNGKYITACIEIAQSNILSLALSLKMHPNHPNFCYQIRRHKRTTMHTCYDAFVIYVLSAYVRTNGKN